MSTAPLRVLFVSITDTADALRAAVCDAGLATEIAHVETPEAAVREIQAGGVDLCFAPSTAGPDASSSLTLALARVGAYVPVIAVVDQASAGFEAIADEGAADFVGADDLTPQSVGRALLVAHARAEAVARFQAVQSDRDALLSATGSVIATLDAEGRLVELRASPPLQSDFGEAAPGTRFASLFASDARAGAVEALRQAHAGRSGRFVQTRARAGRPMLLRWTVARDASGYRAVGVDRSESNREATRAELFRVVLGAILDQVPVTAFVVDGEGAFLFVLDADSAAMQGQSVFEVYRDSPRMVAAIQRALHGEAVSDHASMSGGRHVRLHVQPVPLGTMEPFGALGVLRDHDDGTLGAVEQARLDAALSFAEGAVLLVDSVGEPVYLSPFLQTLTGLTLDELATGGVPRLFDDPSQRTEIARAVRGGDAWSGPVALRGAGGRIDGTITARPVYGPEGARIGGVAQFVPAEPA